MTIAFDRVAAALLRARKARGFSRETLAAKLGLGPMTVLRAERGGDIRLRSLVELAHALDLELFLVPRRLTTAIESIVERDDLPPSTDDDMYREDG